jgi:hypothetical protein
MSVEDLDRIKAGLNGAASTEEPEPTTWEPVDLGPYLSGEIVQPEPEIGFRRTDGIRLIYPGREHVVLGDTESGKTWFALGCVVAEIMKGNVVIYIHYEEPNATSTIERLRLLGLSDDLIRVQLIFVAPLKAVHKEWVDELVKRTPSLVVHDGVNEAMSLQGAGQDVDGASLFRRLLVTPFTKKGVATLACDHLPMVKDKARRDAYGTVHKGNALDGARIQLENFKPMGRKKRGVSNVYVTKDRPGFLRQHGRDTDTPGRTLMGVLAVDDSDPFKPFEMVFHPPRPEDDEDDTTISAADPAPEPGDLICDIVHAMPDHTVESKNVLLAAIRSAGHEIRDTKVNSTLDDLVFAKRLAEVKGRRNAMGYKTTASHTGGSHELDSETRQYLHHIRTMGGSGPVTSFTVDELTAIVARCLPNVRNLTWPNDGHSSFTPDHLAEATGDDIRTTQHHMSILANLGYISAWYDDDGTTRWRLKTTASHTGEEMSTND